MWSDPVTPESLGLNPIGIHPRREVISSQEGGVRLSVRYPIRDDCCNSVVRGQRQEITGLCGHQFDILSIQYSRWL